MKRRIIALLIALATLVTMLAACGDEPAKKPCATHVDADKDLICDGCDRAVISIIEQLPPVEEPVVDMVVNPLPENADITQYLNTVLGNAPITGTLTEIEYPECNDGTGLENGLLFLKLIGDPQKEEPLEAGVTQSYKDTYMVYDLSSYKVLYTYTTAEYTEETAEHKETVNAVSGSELGFRVSIKKWTQDGSSWDDNTVYYYYTQTGVKLADTSANTNPEATLPFSSWTLNNGEHAYVVENEISVYDAETGAKIEANSKNFDLFVDRPEFDTVIGNYGYVWADDGDLLVYDLTKWLSCIYELEIDDDAFIFADGKVVMQSVKQLSDSAVNYDYLEYGSKYDLVYTVVDPVAGTKTEVEFGYYIEEYYNTADNESFVGEFNALIVYPIVHKEISDEAMYVLVDSSLNILYAYETWLPGQGEPLGELVADGVYLVEITYQGGTTLYATVKADGSFLAYIPDRLTDSFVCGFIQDGNKLYNTKLELVFDLEAVDAEDARIYSSWRELTDNGIYINGADGETYLLKKGATAPVKLTNAADADENALNDVTFGGTYMSGAAYVLNSKVEVAGENAGDPAVVKTVQTVYNAAGTKLFALKAGETLTYFEEVEDGVYSVETSEGEYFLK